MPTKPNHLTRVSGSPSRTPRHLPSRSLLRGSHTVIAASGVVVHSGHFTRRDDSRRAPKRRHSCGLT